VTRSGGRRTWRAVVTGGILTLGLGVLLSACGNGGESLAREACTHINRSISLLRQAESHTASSQSALLQHEAYQELRKALPLTAEAAYDDDQWQALMTTVSESNRVSETTLVPALQAQCTQADQSPFNQPSPPSSIPPPAPASGS
jgi:hypothetical protein